MRIAEIYNKGVLAGMLTEENRRSYIFRYDDKYYNDSSKHPVSLTITKNQQEHRSSFLFPFFSNMLSEGANRKLQCKQLKIDENDDFGLLMATARYDTPGSVTVKPVLPE
jgi:HipA-like protein